MIENHILCIMNMISKNACGLLQMAAIQINFLWRQITSPSGKLCGGGFRLSYQVLNKRNLPLTKAMLMHNSLWSWGLDCNQTLKHHAFSWVYICLSYINLSWLKYIATVQSNSSRDLYIYISSCSWIGMTEQQEFIISRHTIVGRAARYSQYTHATDKCVIYRNQVLNAVFMHL